MVRQLLFFLLCFYSLFGFAQTDSLHVYLSTPHGAVWTHLYYLQDETYNEDLASRPFQREGVSPEKAIRSAIMLKQILDGEGIYIEMEEIPKSPNHFDSVRNKHQYVLTSRYPQIYLEKVSNQWLFSNTTIAALDEIHDKVFPLGTDKLLDLLPQIGTRKIMGLHLYQYMGILLLALISVLVHKLFSYLFEKILLNVVQRAGYERLADNFLLPVARPISLFVVILLLVVFLPVLQLPPDTSRYVILLLKALLPLFGTIVFYRIVDILSMYLENMAKRTESTLDDQLVPLIRKTLKTFVVGVGSLFILQSLNIPIIPLLTGLSIGGLAFALAAQDTIKNFFGSLMIFIDRPFQIGDWITSGDIDGTVEEVGFRSSRIRTFRNSVTYVPNGKLADTMIDNHGMRQYRRFYTQIRVTYDTPPELIETFVAGLRKIVENHPHTWKNNFHVYFNEISAYSLNIMFYIFFNVPDWGAELKARHEVLIEVMRLGKELGVNFAFPTQTLHMENFPGQPSLSPSYMEQGSFQSKMEAYFTKADNN